MSEMCVYIGVSPKKTYVLKELKALNAVSLYAIKEFNGASQHGLLGRSLTCLIVGSLSTTQM